MAARFGTLPDYGRDIAESGHLTRRLVRLSWTFLRWEAAPDASTRKAPEGLCLAHDDGVHPGLHLCQPPQGICGGPGNEHGRPHQVRSSSCSRRERRRSDLGRNGHSVPRSDGPELNASPRRSATQALRNGYSVLRRLVAGEQSLTGEPMNLAEKRDSNPRYGVTVYRISSTAPMFPRAKMSASSASRRTTRS